MGNYYFMNISRIGYLRTKFHNKKKYIFYLTFGFLTTCVNFFAFGIFIWLGLHFLLSNFLAFVIAIIFAYLTNRRWVFTVAEPDKPDLLEFIRFVGSRGSTLLLESIILYSFISILGFNQYVVKVAANIVVIISNYLLSEFIVFRGKETSEEV